MTLGSHPISAKSELDFVTTTPNKKQLYRFACSKIDCGTRGGLRRLEAATVPPATWMSVVSTSRVLLSMVGVSHYDAASAPVCGVTLECGGCLSHRSNGRWPVALSDACRRTHRRTLASARLPASARIAEKVTLDDLRAD